MSAVKYGSQGDTCAVDLVLEGLSSPLCCCSRACASMPLAGRRCRTSLARRRPCRTTACWSAALPHVRAYRRKNSAQPSSATMLCGSTLFPSRCGDASVSQMAASSSKVHLNKSYAVSSMQYRCGTISSRSSSRKSSTSGVHVAQPPWLRSASAFRLKVGPHFSLWFESHLDHEARRFPARASTARIDDIRSKPSSKFARASQGKGLYYDRRPGSHG